MCVAIANPALNANREVSVRFAATENLERTENLEAIVVRDAPNVSRAKLANLEVNEREGVIARNVRHEPIASPVENADRASARSDWNAKADGLRAKTVTRKRIVIWDEAMPWPITISRWTKMTMMTMHRSRSRRLSEPS